MDGRPWTAGAYLGQYLAEREEAMGRHKSTTYTADATFSTMIGRRKRSAEQVAAALEWGGWIVRPTDPKYPSIRDIPNGCGIYAWYSRDGDLLYVGRSLTMNNRLRRHHMPEWGGALLSYRLVPPEYLAGVEMAHVKTLEPFHNAAREAASLPFWDAMCAAIDATWREVLPGMMGRIQARESAIIASMSFGDRNRETNAQIAARL